MISEHDFLTQEECKRVRDILFGLKEHWINRTSNFLPFFSMGAASYLDVTTNDQTAYYEAASRSNPILERYFPSLYETLEEKLSDILQMPVGYAKSLALPGFHIFLADKIFENTIASTHFNMQFKPLKWDYKNIDFEHPISFSCPIALPEAPSGLNYWEITKEETTKLGQEEIEQLKSSKEMKFHSYSLGKLALHRGLILHQIAPYQNIKPTDEHITLQGHGIVCDGKMRIYW